MTDIFSKKPELLAPAGSMEALVAAIAGGADAVYFGTSAFNARMNAKNFDRDEIKRAIEKCRNFGVRSNITFNTLVYDREFSPALEEVEFLYKSGADALIIADLGLAAEIKKYFPNIELHASTQMSIHNIMGAELLSELGYTRAVVARELDRDSLFEICQKSPIETEIFIHGALCVSHSGQCLFSSLVGSRSGNRGECAQPCRLPYNGSYPLSLKDNCLAGCFEEVLKLGAASLKIEGRMKSPAYVYGVTSIYRRLIDEGRNAAKKEIEELAALFSRSGFTDGYFKKKIDTSMNGIRTEADKAQSTEEKSFDIRQRSRMVDMKAVFKQEEPSKLTLSLGKTSVTVLGETPEKAINAPISLDNVRKNLLKLGSTDFVCDKCEIELDDGIILPVSKINELRRNAVSALEKALVPERRVLTFKRENNSAEAEYSAKRSARFLKREQIPENASDYFDIIYLPLEEYRSDRANGVIIPPVIFEYELEKVRKMLEKAKEDGARHALITNPGQIRFAQSMGFECHGDFRLNVTNKHSVKELLRLGLADIIPSPELTLVRVSELGARASSNAIVYGRIPMMLLEKCVIKQLSGCESCEKNKGMLTDRMGEKFPVYRTCDHRNTVYNSRVTYMADKKEALLSAGIVGGHYIFTDENKEKVSAVIKAYKNETETKEPIRRIPKK